MIKALTTLFLLTTLGISVSKVNRFISEEKWERPEVNFPEDNPMTEASILLGNELYFETLLSRDSSISCQSCHLITEAFADHLPLGEGIKGRNVTRNSPTLANIGLHPYFMADGKFLTLEDQVMGPINEHREFDMSASEVVERLNTIPRYNRLSKAAYNEEISIEIVQKALANFERIIRSDSTKFDKYMYGQLKLSEQEKQGWELFNRKDINCIECHSGFNFTNYSFENNGLYKEYADSGRALITHKDIDLAKFKVPTLRNIAITSPYMHNGTIKSLEEVIEHYASGGKSHPSKSDFIKGFIITKAEKVALIAFLKTLTDPEYIEE